MWRMTRAPGTLYLVATPIGNLEDITRRALRILAEVDLIACEDTRHTRQLLNHFGIETKTTSYHEHNEHTRAAELAALIADGASVAVVSDAGTPGINDPGYRVVRLCIEQGLAVVPVPGACAFVAALVASGLPTDEFYFGGFLPARANARRTRLLDVRTLPATLIFYEAPHRLADALADALATLGDRAACVTRELTKLHEEIKRAPLAELARHYAHGQAPRGEIVLLIDRTPPVTPTTNDDDTATATPADIAALVDDFARQGLDHRAALKRAARELGLTRDEAYRRLVAARARHERE